MSWVVPDDFEDIRNIPSSVCITPLSQRVKNEVDAFSRTKFVVELRAGSGLFDL